MKPHPRQPYALLRSSGPTENCTGHGTASSTRSSPRAWTLASPPSLLRPDYIDRALGGRLPGGRAP